jgi:hypothetical protein
MTDNLFRKLFRRVHHSRTKKAGRPRRAGLTVEALEERLLLDARLGIGGPLALLDNPTLGSVIGTPPPDATTSASSAPRPHALVAARAGKPLAKASAASVFANAVNDTTILLHFKEKLGRGAVNPASYQIPGLTVLGVTLSRDRRTVTLTTTPTLGISYAVAIQGLRTQEGNRVAARGLSFMGLPAPTSTEVAPSSLGGASSYSSASSAPAPAQVSGTSGDNWIDSFQYSLPAVIDSSHQLVLGKLLVVGKGAKEVDGTKYVFSDSTDPDNNWVLIGWDQQGQPFQPILLARGKVTLAPGTPTANTFSWSNGLYIVRNQNPEVNSHLVKGAYQLLTGSSSMSADTLGNVNNTAPQGVPLTSAVPLAMVADASGKTGLNAAFTPEDVLLTFNKATQRTGLQFSGTQSILLKGSKINFGLGASTADTAKALTISETGALALVNDKNGKNEVSATVSFNQKSITVQQITSDTNEVITTSPHGLTEGEAFQFDNLTDAFGVETGKTYYVLQVLNEEAFNFTDTPGSNFKVQGSAEGGSMSAGKLESGGFSLSGKATVIFTYGGTVGDGNPLPNADWSLKVFGQLTGQFSVKKVVQGDLSVTLGSTDGSKYGITIQHAKDGTVTFPEWAFTIDGNLHIGKPDGQGGVTSFLDVSVANLSVTDVHDTKTGLGTLTVDGKVSLKPAIWDTMFGGQLGNTVDGGPDHGLVFVEDKTGNRHLQSFFARLTIDSANPTKPGDNATFFDKVKLYSLDVSLKGELSEGHLTDLDVAGNVTLAIGDQEADNNGEWKTGVSKVGVLVTAGFVKITENGFSIPGTGTIRFTVSGNFKLGPLQVEAQNLIIELHADTLHPKLGYFLIGGTLTLPQLKNVSVTLGDGGNGDGLKVFTSTGQWQLDGFKLLIPVIYAGPIELDDVTIGFTIKDKADWDLLVAGTFVILKEGSFQGTRITVKLDLGEKNGVFIVNGFGVDLRGLSPGIPILDTGAFLTDIGLDAENLNDPSKLSIDAVLGAAFGDSIQVGGNSYALVQVTAEGKYHPGDIDVIGTLLLAGGLASGTAELDANYALGRYLIDLSLQFYDDFLDGHLRIVIVPGKLDALATLALKVPTGVPLIGGYELGEVDAALELTTERPLVKSVVGGLVTTTDVHHLAVGDPFKFTYLNNAGSFDTTQIYTVTSVGSTTGHGTDTFTFADALGHANVSLNAGDGKVLPGPDLIAGWAKFLFWDVGVEYDFLRQKFSVLGPDAIHDINKDIAGIIKEQNPNAKITSQKFPPPAPKSPTADQMLSTASTGLFQFPITPDASNKLYATINGNTKVVWDPTMTENKATDFNFNDGTPGVRVNYVATDATGHRLSTPNNIVLHVSRMPPPSSTRRTLTTRYRRKTLISRSRRTSISPTR